MTNSIAILLSLSLVAILAYDRIRYGKAVSQGSSKTNTVHAIAKANATVINLYDAVISDILDNQNI